MYSPDCYLKSVRCLHVSADYTYDSPSLSGNDFIVPVNGPEPEMSKVAGRVLEELVRPLRELDITDTEFACLRAIVFFAPGQSRVTDVYPLPHLASPQPFSKTVPL